MSSFTLPVDDSLRTYLQGVSEALAGLPSSSGASDEQSLLTERALDEICGNELRVATDAECSHVFEDVLRQGSFAGGVKVADALCHQEVLWKCASNPFGSHLLETLLDRVQGALQDVDPDVADGAWRTLGEWVFLVREDLADYMANKYSTHVVRHLIRVLGQSGSLPPSSDAPGGNGKGGIGKSSFSGLAEKLALIQQRTGVAIIPNLQATTEVQESAALERSAGAHKAERDAGGEDSSGSRLQGFLAQLAAVLIGPNITDADFQVLQRSPCASPALQSMLAALPDRDAKWRLFLRILGAPADGKRPPKAALAALEPASIISAMKHKTSSHNMEAAMLACPLSLWEPLWIRLKPHAAGLAVNPIANFAVQALLASAPSARHIGDAFHELKGKLPDIVTRNRTGVACVLLVACTCWRTCCEEACRAVADIFPEAGVVLGLTELGGSGSRLSAHGCIILQALLSMPQSACRKVTEDVLALPPAALRRLALDASGCRVLEALLRGTAPRSVKRGMLRSLQPMLAELACAPAPSRLVEALFVWGDLDDKEVIVEALAAQEKRVLASKYGAQLSTCCQLSSWSRGHEAWRLKVQSSSRIAAQFRALFANSVVQAKNEKMRQRKTSKRNQTPGRGEVNELEGAKETAQLLGHLPSAAGVSGIMAELQVGGGHACQEQGAGFASASAKGSKARKKRKVLTSGM